MHYTTKLLAMILLLAAFTTGCQNEHKHVAESSFDDPAVAALLQFQEKAIDNFVKAANSGKIDIAELAEIRNTERLNKQKHKDLLRNMSNSDRSKYMSEMRKIAKKLQAATQQFAKSHGAGL